MMKRLFLLLLTICAFFAKESYAQVPKASKPVCAYCGIDLTTGESHKSSCRYYKKEESSEESWAPNFNSIEYRYGNGVMCEQCGKTNGHVSDCLIGKTQGYARDYWAKSSNSESAKFRIKTYEDNIRLFAKQGREARQRKQAENKAEQELKQKKTTSSMSSSSSSSARRKFSYECELCRAGVMAYNINEAIQEFANKPWIHKSTCKNYKPNPEQGPSTKLKDYTPASERPKVSEPLMDMPLCQPAPQFSGINETNIRHEKPVDIVGEHVWGEIDLGWLAAYAEELGEDFSNEFDIERYNHDEGAVILGTHKDNGRYHWTILERLSNGDLRPVSQQNLKVGRSGYKNIGELRDVHFEGQGKYIIAEYTSGYRQVYDRKGDFFRDGYNIKVLGGTVDGKSLLYVGEDEQTVAAFIINEDGDVIADGHNITQYDDAYVLIGDDYPYYNIFNWHGEKLSIEGNTGFEEIKAYKNNGSYYLLKDKDKGYAIVGRGFRRVGNWYKTEEEAHRVWRASKQ